MIDIPRDPHVFVTGSLIAGRYEVVGSIGSGGMGWVIHVLDRYLENKSVALKLLFPHLVKDERTFARFRRELLVTRDLSHPNIVRMYDLGSTENNYHFISLEFVHGHSLKQLIPAGTTKGLPFPDAVRILHDICQGVAYAHSQGVIHRDLKPDNVLVSTVGEVKICDFGIARSLWQENGLTKTGGAVGTPYYMAPEQIRGDGVDERSDIYSLGIIAFELLTGHRPYDDDNFYKLAHLHMNEPLPAADLERAGAPQWFVDLVIKTTAKEPGDRYQSVDELMTPLREHVPTGRIMIRHAAPSYASIAAADVPTMIVAKTVTRRVVRIHTVFLTVLILLVLGVLAGYCRNNESAEAYSASLIMRWERSLGFRLTPLRLYAGVHCCELTDDLGAALLNAVRENQRWPSRMYLEGGISPNVTDSEGRTPLHFHVGLDDPSHDILDWLLKYGADVNAKDKYGETPLVYAINAGMPLHMAELLAVRGINPNVTDRNGTPAIMLISKLNIERKRANKHDFAKTLSADFNAFVRGDADFEVQDTQGNTLLHDLAELDAGGWTFFKRALGSKQFLESRDPDGLTPILRAAKANGVSTVRVLLKEGASPYARDDRNRSLLQLVRNEEAREAMKTLLTDFGADLSRIPE